MTHYCHSVEETLRFGQRLGERAVGGLVICLVGPLGAGKTHLVKGIAIGNGFEHPERVTSPTFALACEYPGRLRLHHLDLFRLNRPAEVESLGMEELSNPGSLMVIEWADRFRNLLPQPQLWITITPGSSESDRRMDLESSTPEGARLILSLQSQSEN